MAATCVIGGVTYTMVEDQHDLTNALDERQRFQCDIIDYTGTAHFVKGEQVIITDPVLGVIYNGYLVSDKEVPQYPSGAILHTIDCSDQSWLAAKRTYTRTYATPQLSSKIAVDQLHDVLLAEGITQNFALKFDTTQSDFSAGILSSTISTLNVGDGDLELSKAGSDLIITESVTSDFSSGTLVNVHAINNTLIPITYSAMLLQTTLIGAVSGSSVANITVKVWQGSYTIGGSDNLTYDIWINSTSKECKMAIELTCSDGTLLSKSTAVDQNGLAASQATDLTNYASNMWYSRTIALSSLSGKTLTSVACAAGGTTVGSYTCYIKNCVVGSTTVFSTSATATQTSPPVVMSAIGYSPSLTSVIIANVWLPGNSYRISTGHSIDAVKLVKNSLVTVDAAEPGSTTIALLASYDNGNSYAPCTNNSALPALPAGSNITGDTLVLKEVLGTTGSDPVLYPTLQSVTCQLFSAAAATKNDTIATYANATQWNTGTFTSGIAVGSDGSLTCAPNFTRDWNDNTIYGQSLFPVYPATTESAASGAYAITVPPRVGSVGAQANSRLDFAGVMTNFTIEFDAKIDGFGGGSTSGPALIYRTTNWDTGNNTIAYSMGISNSTTSQFGYGSNTGGSGSFTVVASSTARTYSANTFYHFKIVVSGNSHKMYVNNSGTPDISATDSTYPNAGNVGLSGYSFDSGASHTFTFDNFTVDGLSSTGGTWTSPSTSLSSLVTCGGSAISWVEVNTSATGGTTALIQTSIDGGSTYQTCTNTGVIPGLTSGVSLSGKSVIAKVTLTNTIGHPLPEVQGLVLRVLGAYPGSSGTRSTVPLGNDMSITRTVGSGFGTAFDGQTWAQVGTGTTAVTSGEETIANTTGDVHMVLGSRTWTDEDGTCRFSLSAATISAGIELRYTDANNFYRLQATTTTVSIIKMSGGGAITLASVSMALTIGSWYRMRFRVTGATQPLLQGNVWVDGTLEPTISATTGQWNTSNWTITAVD